MRLKFAIGLLTLIIFTAHGQERKLTADSDTIYWQNYYGAIFKQAGVTPIKSTDNESTFRFWDGKKLIEIRDSKDSVTATITFFVKEYVEKTNKERKDKKRKEDRLYFRSWRLAAETTTKLKNSIQINRVNEIPTYRQIIGWDSGHDGRTFIVEYANKEMVSYKSYWSPDIYKNKLKEAMQLTSFIETINEIDEINIIQQKFMNMQPFGTWYTFIGSATVGFQNEVVK